MVSWFSLARFLKIPSILLAVFLLLYLPFTFLMSKVVFFLLSDAGLGERILGGQLLNQQQDENALLIKLSAVVARIAGLVFVLLIVRYWSVLPIVGRVFKLLDAMEAKAWYASTTTRLLNVSPQLVEELSRSTRQMRMRAVAHAIRQAFHESEVNDELVSSALNTLEEKGTVHSQTLEALIGCRNSHDDRYFDLQKANADEQLCMNEFRLARLYNALVYARYTASYEASSEAIYECVSGLDDPMPTVGRLFKILRADDV